MRAVRSPLVYGYTTLHGHSTVVVEEARARRLADELDRVRACTTLGELRTVAEAGLPEAGCPVDLAALARPQGGHGRDVLALGAPRHVVADPRQRTVQHEVAQSGGLADESRRRSCPRARWRGGEAVSGAGGRS